MNEENNISLRQFLINKGLTMSTISDILIRYEYDMPIYETYEKMVCEWVNLPYGGKNETNNNKDRR